MYKRQYQRLEEDALGGTASAPQPGVAADSRGGGPEDPFREDYTRLLFSLYIRETKVCAFVAPQSTWFGNGRRGHGFVWGFRQDMRSTKVALPTDAEAGVGGLFDA